MTTGGFAARVIEAYLLATIVLLAAALAMRLVRQPVRRITASRACFAALAAIAAISLTREHAAIAIPSVATPASRRDLNSVMCCPAERKEPADRTVLSAADSGAGSPPVFFGLIFGAGSAGVAGWLGLGGIASIGLRNRLRPAGARLKAIHDRVVGSSGAAPRLWVADRLGQPIAFGLFRPAIALPARFAGDEPEARVEAAIAHERAHLRNGDLAWLAISRLLLVLFYAHPLYHMLRRRVRLDQETMADADAARASGRIAYAEALLSWSRPERPPVPRLVAALGLCERSSALRERIALLLDRDFRVEPRSPARWRLGVGLAAALLVGALATAAGRVATPVHDCTNCTEHAFLVIAPSSE